MIMEELINEVMCNDLTQIVLDYLIDYRPQMNLVFEELKKYIHECSHSFLPQEVGSVYDEKFHRYKMIGKRLKPLEIAKKAQVYPSRRRT